MISTQLNSGLGSSEQLVNMSTQSTLNDLITHDDKFKYMMLGRLKSDCEYFLGFGARSLKHLYMNTVEQHIFIMRGLHHNLKVKPEWLTLEQIKNYEIKMLES